MNEHQIFAAAIQLTVDQRTAFLDAACGRDGPLRRQVEALLQAHDESAGLLPRPSDRELEATNHAPSHAKPGTLIGGRYKLLEAIGEGGMGTVWVAEQSAPVRRKVALKLIKAGMDSHSVLARFEAERQALAVMDHPNIAKVLDGGLTETGRPYFVMEYVKGVPITDYCDSARLSVRKRLELFTQVCQAVQHAHQKGIIHRDLKPSNILVAPYDDRPVPKVIDFGLAKAMHQSLTERTLHTAHDMVLGTPLYMSPEQAQLNNLDVDTRSDIYSLGVLLYELLTGTTPMEKQRFKEAAWDEIRRIIREEEPPRPSLRLSSAKTLPALAAGRHSEPARLTKLVRGELDWIVMKALDKDRTRRYETANGFAADVQRYLDGEPVKAAPASAQYVLWKFVRRHKGQVLAASLLLACLLAGVTGTTWGLIEAKKQERIAIAARSKEALARQSEAKRADAEAQERRRADEEKQRAIRFRDQALEALRATTGDDVEKLIGSKTELSANEREYLEAIANRWQGFAKQSGTDVETREFQAEGHFRVAALWLKLGRWEEAQAEFQAAVDVQKKLAEQFPTAPDYQYDLAASHNNLGLLLRDLGKLPEARVEFRSARDLYQALAERFPTAPDYQGRLASLHGNLGILLKDLGLREEAQSEMQSARDLQKQLVTQHPEVSEYQHNLAGAHNNFGMLLTESGKLEEALAEYQAARDLHRKLAEQFPAAPDYQKNLAGTRRNLSILLAHLGRTEEARLECQAARDLQNKLAEQFPAVPDYQEGLASTHLHLGNILRDLGKKEEARAAYQVARDLQKTLVQQFPNRPNNQEALAATYTNLATLLADLGRREEARAEYQSAQDAQQKLLRQFPTRSDYQRALAGIQSAFGNLLTNLEEREEARTEYRSAIDLLKTLVERFPDVADYQIDLGGTYCNYGILFLREGKSSESLEWLDRAIDTLQLSQESGPHDAIKSQQYLKNCYWSRAKAYSALQRTAESLDDWDRVIALSSPIEQFGLRANRVGMRLRAGMFAKAAAEVSELTTPGANPTGLPVWTAGQWYDFACVYAAASGEVAGKKQDYSDLAMDALRQAVNAGYRDAAHMRKDADLDLLRNREDFKKLESEIEIQK